MFVIFLEILFAIVVGASIIIYINQLLRYNAFKPIQGPTIVPVIGNFLEFGQTPEDMYHDFTRLVNKFGKMFQLWLGPFAQIVVVTDPEITEKVINSSKHIDKMELYGLVTEWLGDGLLLSTGDKWRKRRKILTPAFHFTILEESIENFDCASRIMVDKLKKHVDGDVFDVYPYITLCGLDIICETAMGIKINAQTQTDSEYVCAVRNMCNIIFTRAFSIFERFDWYFNNFSRLGKIYNKSLPYLHETTDRVIRERRRLLLDELSKKERGLDSNSAGERKKPMAFLDALLRSTIDGKPLTDADVREEVDTFMFEGHDTVSSGLSFTFYLLANHADVQEKVFREIREVLGDDKSKVPTIADLNSLRYLEAVLKESMRLYPPVPIIGRKLTEDLHLDEVTIPNKTSLAILIHWMHRREDLFPEPNVFKPERFLNGRDEKSYFAFIPFSAGPRNCIGQKFAMYEMKMTILNVLRNYELLPSGRELKLVAAIVLKSTNGIPIKLRSRTYL